MRKAFEQGRLLDPAELTDDAVFRLLREDENVRILATQEIEDRSYIRPKPSKQELADDAYWQRTPLQTEGIDQSAAAAVQNANQSQEQTYWTRRDILQQKVPASPSPTPPDTSQPNNAARQLNMARLDSPLDPFDNPFESMGNDYGALSRIRPEELPALLQASQASSVGGATSGMRMPGGDGQPALGTGAAGLGSFGAGSSGLGAWSSTASAGSTSRSSPIS